MAQLGYQVVNARGDVLRTVKPALSEEEYAKLSAEREAAKRQAKADRELLIKYRDLKEIEESRERTLADIVYKRDVAKANLEISIQELARLTRTAADLERKQQPVTDTLKRSIETTREEIRIRRQDIKQLEQDKIDAEAEYDAAEKRFKYLSSRGL